MLCASPFAGAAQFTLQESHTTASLRGIATAGPGEAWASGTGGTVLRTVDGGAHWQSCTVPPGAVTLDFRGVQALDARTALVMASGKGAASRVFKTTDGCRTWHLVLANPDADGFFDSVTLDAQTGQGMLLGDPVAGRFVLYRTRDAGEHWQRIADQGLQAAAPGIGGFAASNSILLAGVGFATSGPDGPFFYPLRKGRAVRAMRVPIAGASASQGIFSVASDGRHLVAVGGDYTRPAVSTGTAAVSDDGGLHWRAADTLQAATGRPWPMTRRPARSTRPAQAAPMSHTMEAGTGPRLRIRSLSDGMRSDFPGRSGR